MAKTRRTQTTQTASYPRRGEIYLTALDPTVGREIQKTRPALIIQNNISNRLTGITIVAPITSTVRFPLNPVHVLLATDRATGLTVSGCGWPPSATSAAVFNQIRGVDRVRLIRQLGTVDREAMERVDEAIKMSLGLIKI